MFIQNKYKNWHDKIISNAKSRILKGYKEKHHIIPRSLGGTDDKENLVELTAREHFIIHMLLCKFTKGKGYHKMLYAFNAMANIKSKNRIYKINSKTSEILKLQFKKLLSNRIVKQETLKKQSKAMKGRKLTEEHKNKIKLACIGKKQSKETIAKRIAKTKGLKRTKEFKQIMSEIASKRIFSQETRKKIGLKSLGNKNSLGKKHTQETIYKIKKANLGNKHTLGMICINKDNKTKMIYKNELQNYLNLGFIKGKIRRTQQEIRNNI